MSQKKPIPTELLKGNARTLILAILREGPSHGYAITYEIEKRTDRDITFRQGSLYPLFHEMENDGLIEGEWNSFGNERPKKTYRITEKGLAELRQGLEALQRLSAAIQKVAGEYEAG